MENIQMELNKAVIKVLLEAAARLKVEQLTNIGLSEDSIDRLSSCNILSSAILQDSANGFVKFDFDDKTLCHQIGSSIGLANRKEIQQECVRRGATRELMTELFKTNTTEFRNMRKDLALTKVNEGYRAPTDQEVDQIVSAWKDTYSLPNDQRYLIVSKRLDVTIRQVNKALKDRGIIAMKVERQEELAEHMFL